MAFKFMVRVGDDGQAHLKTNDFNEALAAAVDLSLSSSLRQAYIRNVETHKNVARFVNGSMAKSSGLKAVINFFPSLSNVFSGQLLERYGYGSTQG